MRSPLCERLANWGATLRRTVTLSLVASAIFILSGAHLRADDCKASAKDRASFVGNHIVAYLDEGHGIARHPGWLRSFLAEPEHYGERLSEYCRANPEAKLTLAITQTADVSTRAR